MRADLTALPAGRGRGSHHAVIAGRRIQRLAGEISRPTYTSQVFPFAIGGGACLAEAQVPNAEIFTSRVINNTASPLRRSSIIVLLDYQQDLTLALETTETAMRSTEGVADDPAPSVRLRDLTPEHMALEARFWTDAQRSDYMHTTCVVRATIVQALKGGGVALPSPDSRILLPGDIERWRAVFDRKTATHRS